MKTTSFIKFVIKPFRKYLLLCTAIMLLYALDSALRPYFMKLFVNTAAQVGKKETVVSLWLIALSFIGLQVLMVLGWRFYEWILLRYEPRMRNFIALTVTQYLVQHDYYFFQKHLVGSLSAKINDLAKEIPSMLTTFINNYFATFISVCIAFYSLWRVYSPFAYAITLTSVILVTIGIRASQRSQPLSLKTAQAASRIIGTVVDQLNNILTIKFFAQQKQEEEYLKEVQNAYIIPSQKR